MSLTTSLLHWYRKNRRDLPWRHNPTPYRVWVSEIMLQQTTVQAVIPYYRHFLKRFPSLRALAKAHPDAVLTAWSGLGYYSRARNLHLSAQICLNEFSGRIPRDVDTLKRLPGIGPYTAGAIASIAFDQRTPIVDGNVARVLSRLLRLTSDPKTSEGSKIYWARAEQILPKKSCGDFNQALMELGATVCTPTRPLCPLCPLRSSCQAYLKDNPVRYPRIAKTTRYRNVHLTAALIQRNGSLIMMRRPKRGALQQMWEFPLVEGDCDTLLHTYSLKRFSGSELKTVRHSIMNQRITITPWHFPLPSPHTWCKPPGSRWIPLDAIRTLPTSSMVHKLMKQIASPCESLRN